MIVFINANSIYPQDPDLVIKDKPFSPRYQVFSELLQTEINYVGVLNTIIAVSNFPCHNMQYI